MTQYASESDILNDASVTPFPGSELVVEVIDTMTEFRAVKAAWQALEKRDPEGTVYLSWEWLMHAFAENPGRWRVLAVRRADQPNTYVCLYPIKYRTHWSKSRSELQSELEAGGRLLWSEYTGFLCQPSYEETAIKLIARHIQSMPWVKLSLRYEVSENRARIFAESFPESDFKVSWLNYRINKGETDNLLCPQVKLPKNFEDYMATSLSTNTRQKLRRLSRKHLDTGDVRITETSQTTFTTNLKILLALWTQKWASNKGQNTAGNVASNYAQILAAAESLGLLYMPVLWRGDRPLGALGHVLDPEMKRVHFIVAGRDETANAPYVGHLLHAHSIKWAIENGYETYDFCHGNEAYKYSFGAEDVRANYFSIRRTTKVEPGTLFDPMSTAEAMKRTLSFIDAGKPDKARAVCTQILAMLS